MDGTERGPEVPAMLDRLEEGALWLCAALAFLLWLPWPEEVPQLFQRFDGQHLIYGIPDYLISYWMPGGMLAQALLGYHTPLWLARLALLGGVLSAAGLCACAVAFLGGRRTAALFLLVFFSLRIFAAPAFPFDFEQLLYCMAFAGVAAALALRGRKVSPLRSALLGLCIGLTLAIRSPLFLFPVLLAAYDLLSGAIKERRAVHLLGLFGPPALLLAPWVYMNWRVHGAFMLFEDGRSQWNMIGSGLGLVWSTEGYTYPISGTAGKEHLWNWLFLQVMHHPARTLSAWGERIYTVLSWQPLLFALAAAGFMRLRRNPSMRYLGLLALYFLAVHTFFPIEPRYYVPLFFLAGIMACGLAAGRPELEGKGFAWSFGVMLAPVFSVCLAALALACAYPHRIPSWEPRVEALAASGSGDSWVYSRLGLLRLGQGDVPTALAFTHKAMSLKPGDAQALLAETLAQYAAGVDLSGLEGKTRFRDISRHSMFLPLLYAMNRLERGQALEAEKRFAKIDAFWKGGVLYFRRARTAYEKDLQKTLYGRENWISGVEVPSFVLMLPPSRRVDMVERLRRISVVSQRLDLIAGEARLELLAGGVHGH
ncbi:MAG: hypothetical protein GX410_03145 [Elusimicrobia bacterium]|nr:hypothetical protein [Elusimicrobiota bacterium]